MALESTVILLVLAPTSSGFSALKMTLMVPVLPGITGAVEYSTLVQWVRNFEHLERGLSEMHRVLRPGGKLVILELSYPDNPFILWCYKLYALHFLPFIGGLISGHKEAYRYLPKSILAFPKADKFVPLLRQAGFRQVAVRKFTFGTCVMYIAE